MVQLTPGCTPGASPGHGVAAVAEVAEGDAEEDLHSEEIRSIGRI